MTKSTEEIIRDRIARKSGKDFQQLFWDILICHHPRLQTPKMLRDLGSDGHDLEKKEFFAVYTPESFEYDNKKTINKINEDYDKFSKEWIKTGSFEKWSFVTKRNLKGAPLQEIAKLHNNGDGIAKANLGLENIVKLALDLKKKNQKRIFNLPTGKMVLKYMNTDKFQSTEVETIMDLIYYISNNAELTEKGFKNTMPDPDKKLERFAKHCEQIKNEIINSALYATAQKEAEKAIGLDKIMIVKIVVFLKQISLRFLRENDNDPMISLDKLTDYFESALRNTDKNFDHNAIRYYLIAEIPKCNVFPNENE